MDAAVEAGVRRVVYVSFFGAAPDRTFTFGRDHCHTEERILRRGWTHVPARQLYLDYVPVFAAARASSAGPRGTGASPRSSRDDVADSPPRCWTGEPHDGANLRDDRPRGDHARQAAEILGRVAGPRGPLPRETLEEARLRPAHGAPDFEVEGWVTSYAAVAEGDLDPAATTSSASSTAHRRSLAQVLREHPESYRHLLHPAA